VQLLQKLGALGFRGMGLRALNVRGSNTVVDMWQNHSNMREVGLDGQHVL